MRCNARIFLFLSFFLSSFLSLFHFVNLAYLQSTRCDRIKKAGERCYEKVIETSSLHIKYTKMSLFVILRNQVHDTYNPKGSLDSPFLLSFKSIKSNYYNLKFAYFGI